MVDEKRFNILLIFLFVKGLLKFSFSFFKKFKAKKKKKKIFKSFKNN
jgi:hypothetical protein